MSTSKKRVSNKRELLRQAAVKEFAKNGITHTAITKITKRAGVATGTFYSYFVDKESLLEEVLAEHFADVIHQLEDGRGKLQRGDEYSDVPGQIAAIRGLFDSLIRLNTDNKDLFITWYRYGFGHTKEIDKLISGHVQRLVDMAIDDMQRSGTISAGDIPVLAQCVISLCHGMSQHILTTGTPTVDDAVLYVMRFTIGGLAGYIGQGENAVKAAQLLSGFMQMANDKEKEDAAKNAKK